MDDDGATDSDDVTITVEVPVVADPEPEPEPDNNTTGEVSRSILTAINAVRTQAQVCDGTGYPAQDPFQWNSDLATIAKLHSMDMATKGYFSHTSADGTRMGDRVFPYWSGNRVGENIAASSVDRSAEYVVGLWMSSTQGHCELIMDPDFTHAGVGAAHNTQNNYNMHHFWTLDVGG